MSKFRKISIKNKLFRKLQTVFNLNYIKKISIKRSRVKICITIPHLNYSEIFSTYQFAIVDRVTLEMIIVTNYTLEKYLCEKPSC